MRVFITGATGHIGFAVARLFARCGHAVFGLTRSERNGVKLAREEICPVLGNIRDLAHCSSEIVASEVIIHCAAEFTGDYSIVDEQAVTFLLESARAVNLPRKFIYTSGVWVYGNTGADGATEGSALNPIPGVKARVQLEERIISANSAKVRTVILRPGCVYGGGGSLTAAWFESATTEGAAKIPGAGNNRWAMIHRDDLAEMYLLAAESPLGGEIFNSTDRSRYTVLECATAASHAAGARGRVTNQSEQAVRESFPSLADGLLLDQHVDSSKAVRLLGWHPRHGGFVDGASRYYAAWRAARGAL